MTPAQALHGITDDYMTSEAHHPGYVLIPTDKFEQLRAASEALTSGADWFTRNADRTNPRAFINTNPEYFGSECADAIRSGRLSAAWVPEQAGAVPAGEVERLRRVLADATPVPWRMEHGAISAHIHQVDGLHWLANCVIGQGDWHSPAQSRGVKDATLIVEAVNALPKLLAMLSAAPTPPDAGPGERVDWKVAARNAAADYLQSYSNWSTDEGQKVRNGHRDNLATVQAFMDFGAKLMEARS